MVPNQDKSTIMTINFSLNEKGYTLKHFLYRTLGLEDGIKYLGYKLKPNNYHIADWTWLIANIEARINFLATTLAIKGRQTSSHQIGIGSHMCFLDGSHLDTKRNHKHNSTNLSHISMERNL